MSVRCISWAYDQKTGSPTTKLVLLKLADNANDDGECYPSQSYIARHCELSRESVNRHIRRLEALGLLSIRRRSQEGVKLPNMYTLNVRFGGARLGGVVTDDHRGSGRESQGVVTESHIEPSVEPSINRVCQRFTPPTVSEVRAYCKERGNGVDPQRWHDHYTANGWKVGKNPMKDWRAAVRTWERDHESDPRAELMKGAL